MSLKPTNIFQEATQLISLDCSSITGQNIAISRNVSQNLHRSLLNLKTVLPIFTAEYAVFKEEIMEMTYYILNKLMNVIKSKNQQVTKLQDDLIKMQDDLVKSQSLTNGMKKQVIQLKEMISQFMQSYSKEIQIKQKQISQKQKQLTQLKSVLQQNFNSPRSSCPHCPNIACQLVQNRNPGTNSQAKQAIIQIQQNDLFFKYQGNKDQILIQMSESIVCQSRQYQKRSSLQIIQQQGSDINSLTDYLYSQRYSQNPDKDIASKQISQATKSPISGKSQTSQIFYTGKGSFHNSLLKPLNGRQKHGVYSGESQYNAKDFTPYTKQMILSSPDQAYGDGFGSRMTAKQAFKDQGNKTEGGRRCSEHIVSVNSLYDGYRIQRKSGLRDYRQGVQKVGILIDPQQKITLRKTIQQVSRSSSSGDILHFAEKDTRKQIQQLSRSSSLSDILHFGDTDKININLPKKLQSPRKMNFIQKNSARIQKKSQKLRTQPSPRSNKLQINKENINIDFSAKPVQMVRKILTRKKTITTHAKTNPSCRLQQKSVQTNHIKPNDNTRNIQIKYIQSPQKVQQRSTHLLKPQGLSIFSSADQSCTKVNNYIMYSSVSSNISNINESVVRSHHDYHSTGKYQDNSTGKYQENSESVNSRYCLSLKKSTSVMTTKQKPYDMKQKTYDRKSNQKSRQKLKVVSKNSQLSRGQHNKSQGLRPKTQQNNSEGLRLKSQQKQHRRALTQMMNQNNFMTTANSNSFSKVKIKPKNLSVHFGSSSSKVHLKQKLSQIRNALKNYSIQNYISRLDEVFNEGKYTNGVKEGSTKIVYDNGLIYEGSIRNTKRQGEGKFILNGIDIFQGLFVNDQIQGQGYLKFLRYLTHPNSCHQSLQDASYFGRFVGDRFDGMGTLFLNQKQKIVTKFTKGIPYGELTFYTENDIQFGHWPNQ